MNGMLQHPSIQLWSLPQPSPSKMLAGGQDRSSSAVMATGEITDGNRLVIALSSHVHTLAQGAAQHPKVRGGRRGLGQTSSV